MVDDGSRVKGILLFYLELRRVTSALQSTTRRVVTSHWSPSEVWNRTGRPRRDHGGDETHRGSDGSTAAPQAHRE